MENHIKKEVFSIGKNSSIYVLGRALSQAVGFLMVPIYTSYISPSSYGAMELIEILSALAMMIITLGVGDSMSRFYYAEKDSKKRDEIISTYILGLFVFGVFLVLILLSFSDDISNFISKNYLICIRVSFVSILFGMLCEIGFTYLRMLYLARAFVFLTTIQLILSLFLNIYFLIVLEMDILGIFYSTLIVQALIGVVLSCYILRRVGTKISIEFLIKLVHFGLPLVPARMGEFIGFVSNRFFLRFYGSSDPITSLSLIGLYSLGHKFGSMVNRFVNTPFNSFWGPRRMEILISEDAEGIKTVGRICTYSTFLSVYCAVGLAAGAEGLIKIWSDPLYHEAHSVVPFVALSYVVLALDKNFSAGYIFKKKTSYSSYTSLISLTIVILWNVFTIPRYGIVGAATSNLAGFTVKAFFDYNLSQRIVHIPFELKRISKLLITGIFTYILCMTINIENMYLSFCARIVMASMYPIFLYTLSFYYESELDYMKTIILGKLKQPAVLKSK